MKGWGKECVHRNIFECSHNIKVLQLKKKQQLGTLLVYSVAANSCNTSSLASLDPNLTYCYVIYSKNSVYDTQHIL